MKNELENKTKEIKNINENINTYIKEKSDKEVELIQKNEEISKLNKKIEEIIREKEQLIRRRRRWIYLI